MVEKRRRKKTTFKVQKTGTTYRIGSYLIAKRSDLNEIGVYLIYISLIVAEILGIFLVYSSFVGGVYSTNEVFNSILFSPFLFFLLIPIIIAMLINSFVDIRRITIYGTDGSELGKLKGNLFFTRWRIRDFTDIPEITLRFALIQGRGEIQTPSELLIVKTHDTGGGG